MSSDLKIKELGDTIKELESNITELENILFNPSQYREAFALNSEEDLFEILKDELVEYCRKKPEYKKFLMKSLDLTVKPPVTRAVSPGRTGNSSAPKVSVVSPAIFSPRRSTASYLRGSSRPMLT